MDDLTRIKGVGDATAKALSAAGVDGFSALAAADAEALMAHEAFRGMRASPGDIAAWKAEAAAIAASPKPSGADGGAAPTGGETVPSGLVVFVRGPRRGRWRIGRFFGPEGREIALDALNGDEKAALIGDPLLSVETREASQ